MWWFPSGAEKVCTKACTGKRLIRTQTMNTSTALGLNSPGGPAITNL